MEVNRLRDPGFLDGKPKSRSFRDALAGDAPPSEFLPLRVASHLGMPALLISDEELHALAIPFEFSLVGKFPARRPSLEVIWKFFFNLKLAGAFSVTVLNQKNVLIKLVNDLDYCRVFSHRSYFISNCFMKLFKWTPLFDVFVESPIVPIWASFPNLRPHLFSPRILHGLGSMFGRPLRIDNATMNGIRPSVARILVELDVTKRYAKQVWLGSEAVGYTQLIELEDFPSYCFHCKSLGHVKDCSPILFPNTMEPIHNCSEVDASNPVTVSEEVPMVDEEVIVNAINSSVVPGNVDITILSPSVDVSKGRVIVCTESGFLEENGKLVVSSETVNLLGEGGNAVAGEVLVG
ncbi:hypothetical protein KFK09_001957 [Dendrobium nobile]|uniref:DUF4283 domain-containing protein n=1 Tax=Dendrobium nobile TaxID=94219 RepID=A0A8T3C8X8_DENNO|nr:hypothetical protein KFK09_001957 [Dendrobium nobile]